MLNLQAIQIPFNLPFGKHSFLPKTGMMVFMKKFAALILVLNNVLTANT